MPLKTRTTFGILMSVETILKVTKARPIVIPKELI